MTAQSEAIVHAVKQARAIKNRADFEYLPQDVKDWVNNILDSYKDTV